MNGGERKGSWGRSVGGMCVGGPGAWRGEATKRKEGREKNRRFTPEECSRARLTSSSSLPLDTLLTSSTRYKSYAAIRAGGPLPSTFLPLTRGFSLLKCVL